MLVLLLCVLVGSAAFAQSPTGTIVGTVLDPQGLPVEGASITLTNSGTNYTYSATSSSNGAFQFNHIDYGVYQVSVTKQGFRGEVVSNIRLDAATEYTVPPIRLEVGITTESITVQAGPETVNTVNAEITGTTEKKQIDELPILDRNPLALLSLQAGVANSGPGGGTETTINGQRSSFSTVTIDGINIQDNFIRENALDYSPNLPFISQTQEFTVTQQNGDVDKSGSSGVSIVTPKGTNDWHGEGFWYYRTNAWKANDWFNDASGAPKASLIQNQGGGNIGGPIKKDKLFIYGYYELLRLRSGSPFNATTLSSAIQQGIASSTPTVPFTYQPVDGQGNPKGNPVTVNLLAVENGNPNRNAPNCGKNCPLPLPSATTFTVDPAMAKLIQRVPLKSNNNRVGDGVNLLGYQFVAQNNNTLDNTGTRVDYNLNSKNTISASYAYNRQRTDRPDIDQTFDTVPKVYNNNHSNFLSTAWRWNPNQAVTNEVRFGFNLAPGYFYTNQSFASGFTINSGGFPFTGPDPNFLFQGRNTRAWVGQDNASWVKGNHTLKFGFQLLRITVDETNAAGIYPDYGIGFSQNNHAVPDTTDFTTPSGGLISQADFGNAVAMLASAAGVLSNVSQTFNVKSQTSGYVPIYPTNRNWRQNNFALYAADNWRLTPKLTVNYGVRWEYFSPVTEKDGLTLLPVIPKGLNVAQTLLTDATVDFASGNGGKSLRPLYNGYWKAFSPNIGVAWDPFGNGKTAVRAGFSMNYANDSFFTAAGNAVAGNAGLSTSLQANTNGGLPAGFTVSNPATITTPPFSIPVTFSQNANIVGVAGNAGYAIDPNLKPPYVEQWNLSVQRYIGADTTVTVGYVGNHGVGLFRATDVNQLNFNAKLNCAVVPAPCSTNTFFQDFQAARAAGFASLAATNGKVFDPTYNCGGTTSPTCLPTFYYMFGGGIDPNDGIAGPIGIPVIPSFVDEIRQGQIGALVANYHFGGFDTGFNPGPSFNNWINFFANPFLVGGDLLKNTSFSTYNAAVIELRRRLSNGFYMQANYVFSKVMTDYAPSNNNDQSRFQPFQDNARPGLERARAPFDFNHQFKANFTYELPFGKGHRFFASENRLVNLLVNGWETGSIFTWQSGQPFSIISGQATFNRSGLRSSRNTAIATLSHSQINGDLGVFKTPGGIVYLINPKLISPDGTGTAPNNGLTCAPVVTGGFCNPQPGQVGNLQLYAFTAPSYFDWDITAQKRFDLTERVKLSFRTDAFNLLNHPVFAPPTDANGNALLNINNQRFGQSTSTVSSPRILQMSLTLKF